jgi:translation initiation factor IF-3
MYKDIQERKREVNEIIVKLTELELTIQYEPIKKLFKLLKEFIENGCKIKVSIPFEIINRRIKGELLPGKREKSWIKLENEK